MSANIGIDQKHLDEISQILSHILADEFVLYTKTRSAHWNIEGPDFYSMHVLFESQYTDIAEVIDKVAERIRMLGHYAPGTLKQMLALTELKEQTEKVRNREGFVKDLMVGHEAIIIRIRKHIINMAERVGDAGTVDLLTGLIAYHEKVTWILRSYL